MSVSVCVHLCVRVRIYEQIKQKSTEWMQKFYLGTAFFA